MTTRYLEPAKAEFEEAIDYYRRIAPDVESAFKRAIHRAVMKIIQSPSRWPRILGEYRRCLLNRPFKYAIVYRANDEEIVIVAFTHLARKPNYWADRE